MNFNKFLTVSGAITIALVAIFAVTFPVFIIFVVLGYMFIQENIDN